MLKIIIVLSATIAFGPIGLMIALIWEFCSD
jgi:hypothetical protein